MTQIHNTGNEPAAESEGSAGTIDFEGEFFMIHLAVAMNPRRAVCSAG